MYIKITQIAIFEIFRILFISIFTINFISKPMNKKYSTTRIYSKTFTEENWKTYFEIRAAHANHKGYPLSFASWAELKENTLISLKEGFGIYLVYHGDRAIGYFMFDIRLKEDPNRRYVYLRDYLIEDLDTRLLKKICLEFVLYDPKSKFLVIKSIDGQYDYLEKEMHAEIADYQERFELKVENAKMDIINNWFETYSEKFNGFELRHYEDIPDTLLKEYCDVFLELLDDMPDESKIYDFSGINPKKIKAQQIHFRKYNQCSYRYLVFNDSKLIAKTNVSLNKKKPKIMYQYMTGVLKKYRKKGIGKWLKAVMFIRLTQDFPGLKILKTQIHANNIPSQKLSLQMGYEKVGYLKEYLISKKTIEKFLSDDL